MLSCDWSSDVCSSDLRPHFPLSRHPFFHSPPRPSPAPRPSSAPKDCQSLPSCSSPLEHYPHFVNVLAACYLLLAAFCLLLPASVYLSVSKPFTPSLAGPTSIGSGGCYSFHCYSYLWPISLHHPSFSHSHYVISTLYPISANVKYLLGRSFPHYLTKEDT